ncbi:MAG: GIY-YIG nuclease family protein, partial [Patescibacteria group bacterium]
PTLRINITISRQLRSVVPRSLGVVGQNDIILIMYYVYMIKNTDNKLYVGITKDLDNGEN